MSNNNIWKLLFFVTFVFFITVLIGQLYFIISFIGEDYKKLLSEKHIDMRKNY